MKLIYSISNKILLVSIISFILIFSFTLYAVFSSSFIYNYAYNNEWVLNALMNSLEVLTWVIISSSLICGISIVYILSKGKG